MNNCQNLNALDMLTIFSVLLQVMTYEQGVQQLSNDDIMREIQRHDRDYFEKIIENQNRILEKLAELG